MTAAGDSHRWERMGFFSSFHPGAWRLRHEAAPSLGAGLAGKHAMVAVAEIPRIARHAWKAGVGNTGSQENPSSLWLGLTKGTVKPHHPKNQAAFLPLRSLSRL